MTPPGAAGDALAQARRLCGERRFNEAIGLLKRHLKTHRNDSAALGLLGVAYSDTGSDAEARKSLLRALRIDPKSPDLLCWYGRVLAKDGQLAQAIEQYSKARSIEPRHRRATRSLVDAMIGLGKGEEAHALLTEVMKDDPDAPDYLVAMTKVGAMLDRSAEGLRAAEALRERKDLSAFARTQALFARGDFLAKLGEPDRAFEAYLEANQYARTPYDAQHHAEQTDRMIEVWTRDRIESIPESTRKSDQVVFIIGMPRSGTSLVEQIAASHPKVFGAGELPLIHRIVTRLNGGDPEPISFLTEPGALTGVNVDLCSRHYLDKTRAMAPGADRITDKMPYNFRSLGMITRLFPAAKIVHCVRDPRDTCLSCFFLYFMSRENGFTFDLADLGSFYADYERLMRHWKSVLDIPILDVVYEEMIADQDGQSRRLIEFLGLDWDDRCIEFHKTKRTTKTLSVEQVNKPIYASSIARWKPYEKHLGPLLERLPSDSPPGAG